MGSIEEEIRITGGQRSKQELDAVAEGNERVARTTDDAGDAGERGARSFDGLNSTFQRGVAVAKSFVGGLIGALGVQAALSASREEADKARESLEKFADSMAAVIALSKDPKLLSIATDAAISSGRDIGQIGDALFAIVSGTAGASRDEQVGLLQESLEIGKGEPGVGLGEITELLLRLRNVSGGRLDAQQIQNLAIATEDLGQIDIGQLARFLPRTLKPGETAGLELSETSAVFALLSQVLKPELAATATEGILTRLAAPGAEGEKILKQRGVQQGAGVLDILETLSGVDALSAKELRDLVGEGPGASGLPVLLEQFEKLIRFRDQIRAATQIGAPDLGAEKVDFLRTVLPGFSETEVSRQAAQRTEAARREDPNVAIARLARAALEDTLTETDSSGFSRSVRLGLFDALVSVGFSPATSVALAGGTGVDDSEQARSLGGLALDRLEELSNQINQRPAGNINITNIGTNYDGSRAEAGTVSPTPAEVGD